MSIESMKEDGVYIEDPQKAKEIQDALNSGERAFADIKPAIKSNMDCKYYDKDYPLKGICKLRSNWNDSMPIIKYCPKSPCEDYKEDKCIILKGDDGREVYISEDKMITKDKYGDVVAYSDGTVCYKQNSPTYDELYEHWLKTKDGPKKRGVDKLPGQLDVFDIIDKESNND